MMRVMMLLLPVAATFLWAGMGNALVIPARGCAPTAEEAVLRLLAQVEGVESAGGYRVAGLRVDRVQARTWALVESCADTSVPMRAVVLPQGSAGLELVSVRLGDAVRVVRQGAESRLEMAGWAEDAGGMGDRVRVRLPRFSEDASEAPPVIECRVVGMGVVEVVR